MKTLNMFKCCTLVSLAILGWLLSACQVATETEPVIPTPMTATETAVVSTSTPILPTPVEPSPDSPTETPELSTSQVTPEATPSGDGQEVGWVKTDSAVLRTTDAGASWEDVTPDGIPEMVTGANGMGGPGLAAAFSEGDYALAAYPQGDQAVVFRTSNGGRSWDEAMVTLHEEVQGITSIALIGEQLGWMLATRGLGAGNDWVDLYHSEDGGESWSFISGSESEANPGGGISSGGIKSGLSFNSSESGWLTGSAPIDLVYLFRTLDGGLTWQPYHLPLPEGVSFSGSSYPPIFFDEQNGILPATIITMENEPGLLFYETIDAGESWTPTILLEGQITAWDWLDRQHAFTAGTDEQMQSKLFVTADGGKSWEAYPVEMVEVRALDFISEQEGWAICGWEFAPRDGCSGDIYHTQDGGRSWERVYP